MGKKEEILEVLQDSNLTASEITEKLNKRDFQTTYNIELVRNYLLRLLSTNLIEKVDKKKQNVKTSRPEFIYRSIINRILLLFEKLELNEVPIKLQNSIYEIIIDLLPTYMKAQLNNGIESKTQEFEEVSEIIKEKSNLYI